MMEDAGRGWRRVVASPKPIDIEELKTGEIGFITTGIKILSETKVGDTIFNYLQHLVFEN